MIKEEKWSTIIKPHSGVFDIDLKEVWNYRDLLWLFVKRDVVTVYKQTILGPLWFFIKPILTTIMFTFVFGKMAKIPTDGLPQIIFYLLGITIWGYFSECLGKTSNTFVANQGLFGKVYFPRVIAPASIVISNLGKFLIQFCMFLGFWAYYLYLGQVTPSWHAILLPLVVMIMAFISLGFGMIFSSMTTKYRDLSFLLSFGVQLWMYATPVIYPLSGIPTQYANIVKWNPIAPLIESMRVGFLGKGQFSWFMFGYSSLFAVLILLVGIIIFSRVEKNFMDTV